MGWDRLYIQFVLACACVCLSVRTFTITFHISSYYYFLLPYICEIKIIKIVAPLVRAGKAVIRTSQCVVKFRCNSLQGRAAGVTNKNALRI